MDGERHVPVAVLSMRQAVPDDVDAVMRIVHVCIHAMQRDGIEQWDDVYPDRATFLADARDGTLHRMSKDNWDAVIRTNLDSAFNMTRLVIEGMRSRSFGRIISISSINGRKGQLGQANYSAAKAGLLGFTKAVAQEGAARGITANVIAPGYISTEMVQAVPKDVLESKILPQIPVGRLGESEEVARCVVFLAADEAGFITGSCLDANGGQYMA